MATVSYKNQPAIHKTGAHVPLAGDSHIYTVNKVLWPEEVSLFLRKELLEGKTLHVCSGKSTLGNCKVDLFEVNVNVKADAVLLPFQDHCWEIVLCDPPYNGKFQWNHDLLSELSRVAKNRIVFQHWFIPADKYGRYKKNHNFILSGLYIWQPKTYFGRAQVISVFDNLNFKGCGIV